MVGFGNQNQRFDRTGEVADLPFHPEPRGVFGKIDSGFERSHKAAYSEFARVECVSEKPSSRRVAIRHNHFRKRRAIKHAALAPVVVITDGVENESLARRSYEAGEMALAELLLVRGETLDTRREYLERLLEAALAAVDVEASAGALE